MASGSGSSTSHPIAAPPAGAIPVNSNPGISNPIQPAPAKPAANTEQKVAGLLAKRPDMTQADVAARLNLSERTVRRYWPKVTTGVNGHHHGEADR